MGALAAPARASLSEDPPDVVFTPAKAPAVAAKALELGNDPVRIYEFVRNELEFQNYFGLMKGPEATLLSGGGSDYDLAALLVSLLRASGIPARFARGVVELTPDDAAAWTGIGPLSSADLYLRYGGSRNNAPIPPNLYLLHVWVEAEVPMAFYRGAGADPRGKVWIPLDPSFKLSDWPANPGLPIGTAPALTFDYTTPTGLYGKVHAKLPAEFFEDQVRAYLAANAGTSPQEVEDLLLLGRIRKEAPGVLPNARPGVPRINDPYGVRRGATLAELHQNPPPDYWPQDETDGAPEYRYGAAVHVCAEGTPDCVTAGSKLLTKTSWTAEWEGKPVLLTFPPVEPSLVPDTGYASCTSQILTRPTLSVGGQVEATGSEIPLCTTVEVAVVIDPPISGRGDSV
jgi:hypothetical protein